MRLAGCVGADVISAGRRGTLLVAVVFLGGPVFRTSTQIGSRAAPSVVPHVPIVDINALGDVQNQIAANPCSALMRTVASVAKQFFGAYEAVFRVPERNVFVFYWQVGADQRYIPFGGVAGRVL